MSSFAAARALQVLLPRIAHVTPWSLIETIFGQSTIIADDMRYGPFTFDMCVFEDGEGSNPAVCVVNYGATRISVWSVERALNASVPPLTSPVTPSMQYHDADSAELSSTHLVAIIAGALTALLLLAAALATLLCFLSRGARDNNNAPKDLMEPVTLIFTDIESSTAQWAAHPELMPDAVAAHHRIIRSLIVRYECYEVKTVGDSFMIACRSPHAAVNLVTDLQQRFLHHDWGTTAFDDSYREFEQQRAEEVEGYVPPTSRLDPDVYRRLWNGLRVRSGVHTGLCDIRHDEVTKGYDYYGQTANMAARTESIANGGQVLLTRATYYSLSTAEREHTDVTMVGTVPLRGVQEPVEMYQLNVVTGRKHGALCLGREVAAECEEGPGTSASDASSLHVELTEGAQNIAISLESLLGAFPHAQRQKLLMSFCERWRIALPQGSSGSWSRTFCNDVTRLIAAKVGRVTDFGSRDVDRSRTSTMRNSSIFSSQVHGARAAGSILELSAPHRAGADEAARNVSHSPGGSELSSMASYSTIHIMPFKGLSGVL
ncbi:unnamed protein product [Trypanosoma congolense IL3000]|uniref:adenylate cyclase n=1 Tax=Trypanosoma congolense (strain IL3000) TaxID=1068625 RepID=F9W3S3_TRYCI|nr:unnamed protein product [Trypanosoma congolense IL3000]